MAAPEDKTTPALIPVNLRDDGVLWAVNKSVFHPRGFALAIDMEDGALTLMGDGTEVWSFAEGVEDEPFVNFHALLDRARAAATEIPEEQHDA